MSRMREVGRRRLRPGPLAAHEWEPAPGTSGRRSPPRGTVTVDHRAAPCGRSEVSVRWPSKEEPMHSEDDRRSIPTDRRLVGVDLGIASDHTVRVPRGDGSEVCRRRTRLEVVMEPTGPAWLPVAVFFIGRGHRVFRVASAKAADLRRFLSRHAKSNGIDADTLARLPLLAPGSLQPLELPGASSGSRARVSASM